jgi:hypothetical protein
MSAVGPLRPKKRTSRQSLAPAMHQRPVQAHQHGVSLVAMDLS